MSELLIKFQEEIGAERYKLASSPATWPEVIDLVIDGEVTYFPDGTIQCPSLKNRSITDTVRVVWGHFPETPLLEIATYFAKKLFNNEFFAFRCVDIMKIVICRGGRAENRAYTNGLYHRSDSWGYVSVALIQEIQKNFAPLF